MSISIRYNYNTDNITIKTSDKFEALPKIHQLDALQDGIELITELYNKKLKEFNSGDIEGKTTKR